MHAVLCKEATLSDEVYGNGKLDTTYLATIPNAS